MNYTEFKLELLELGRFKLKTSGTSVAVSSDMDYTVMSIAMDERYVVNILSNSFINLDTWTREQLFKLGMTFASTPIDERAEEDLYYAHFLDNHLEYTDESYLVKNRSTKTYELGSKDFAYGFQTQFTLKQLDEARVSLGLSSTEFVYKPEREEQP